PFFTTKSAGRGLGLAVVQGIVRNLGGVIQLASEPGKGTAFHVLLPCASVTASATKDSVSGARKPARLPQKSTILAVEDEDHLCEAVVKVVRTTGFDVCEIENGTDAINLLRANGSKIDVILLDMTIPGASSDEVINEAIKNRSGIK